MRYRLTLTTSQYVKVADEYRTVNAERDFEFTDWDDVQNLIGYLVQGASGSVKFEITKYEEA